MTSTPKLLRLSEVADKLSISQTQVRRLIARKELAHFRIGVKSIRVEQDAVEEYLQRERLKCQSSASRTANMLLSSSAGEKEFIATARTRTGNQRIKSPLLLLNYMKQFANLYAICASTACAAARGHHSATRG